jgi:uncharacterized protein YkwD
MVLQVLRTAALLTLIAVPGLACSRAGGEDALIAQSAINQDRLTNEILVEVNYYRCRHGRAALRRASDRLMTVAYGHSTWMAGADRMSHTGGRSTGRTLTDRFQRSGLSAQTYAENLAYLPRLRFGGKPFQINDQRSCRFTSFDGQRVGAHTYRSLARTVVKMWMESPGHRKNLLSSRQREMSAAASLKPDGYCGRLYITQMFLG